MATLLGALFLCLTAGGLTAGGAASADPAPLAHHAMPVSGAAQYSCPYDRGDCGLFPHADPAVLTAPPLDTPALGAAHAVRAAAVRPSGAPVRGGARPRAPDLHVLQVLRT
ncbi:MULTISPECIES: hypothetical protein [unclassified Streptomyces]|uniref:Uncharacterized protein n=1 Tax=Streptomyces sp. NBC_00060 TaxID=2975636 RepID=A0AAU2H7A4_9ACTN